MHVGQWSTARAVSIVSARCLTTDRVCPALPWLAGERTFGRDDLGGILGLLCALAARGDAAIAAKVAADALTQAVGRARAALPDVVWADWRFTRAYRAPLDVLAPALRRAASDAAVAPAVRESALSLLRELSPGG